MISNAEGLVFDGLSGRVLSLEPRSPVAIAARYAPIRSGRATWGAVRDDGTISLLVDSGEDGINDGSSRQRIVELGPDGSTRDLPLPSVRGRFTSLAPWSAETYVLTPLCASYLATQVARDGRVLATFGTDGCSAPSAGVRFATHSRAFSVPNRGKLYTVDTKEGRIRVWDREFHLVRTIDLPPHPRHDEIEAAARARPNPTLMTLDLYGVPVLTPDGLLLFPGNRRGEEPEKTPFGIDSRTDTLRTFRPVLGRGFYVISRGKEGMLIDQDAEGSQRCYPFTLNEHTEDASN